MINEKSIIKTGALFAVLLAMYIVLGKKKDDGGDDNSQESTSAQNIPDPKLDVKIREKSTKGLTIISKVDSAKLRTEPFADDGFIDNLYGEIPKSGTKIGLVTTAPIEDKGGAFNKSTQQKWKWLGVTITDAVYKEIQDNQRNFLTRDVWANKPKTLYIREDVIKL
jgi:hypothetical protein